MIGARASVALVGVLLLGSAGAATAADVWTMPVSPAPTIAGCAPGALTVGLGCLRFGGAVEASMGVASLPAWQTNTLAPPRTAATSSRLTALNQPSVAARLSADVRVPTEFGPVRAYVSIRNVSGRRADGF